MAEAQPNVCHLHAVIRPSLTHIHIFMTSPHAGEPIIPVPSAPLMLAVSLTKLRGLRKWSFTVSEYAQSHFPAISFTIAQI
jgi:hypothetical protein